jgi:hypothetical protein
LSGVKRMVQSLTNEQEAAQINSLLDQWPNQTYVAPKGERVNPATVNQGSTMSVDVCSLYSSWVMNEWAKHAEPHGIEAMIFKYVDDVLIFLKGDAERMESSLCNWVTAHGLSFKFTRSTLLSDDSYRSLNTPGFIYADVARGGKGCVTSHPYTNRKTRGKYSLEYYRAVRHGQKLVRETG